MKRLDPGGAITAQVLRDTFDQLCDGTRTQRHRWDRRLPRRAEGTQLGRSCRARAVGSRTTRGDPRNTAPPLTPLVRVPPRRVTTLHLNHGAHPGIVRWP
ncbi:NaeI family type II restriction endonuclease [Gordonia sp. C13]|uniref:NaeI family type II restriction endonuclease n=1 Tax=Gordonia sp. C13 TaxID=2935078 RepID=UPI0035A97A16